MSRDLTHGKASSRRQGGESLYLRMPKPGVCLREQQELERPDLEIKEWIN
jgi:hypothetical protein